MVAKGMQTGRGRQARAGCAGVWPGLRTRTPGCAKRSSRLEAECERLGGENQRLGPSANGSRTQRAAAR